MMYKTGCEGDTARDMLASKSVNSAAAKKVLALRADACLIIVQTIRDIHYCTGLIQMRPLMFKFIWYVPTRY